MRQTQPANSPTCNLTKVELGSLQLLENSPYRRDMPLPAAQQTETYVAKFDAHTLVYDAIEGPQRISLFCPRLLNLWPLLRDGVRLDGAPVRVRRHRYLRFERLDLPKGARGVLTVEIDGKQMPLALHPTQTELFAGLDTMITMVKDTPAQWIVDWVNYHASAHGAQALVLMDNGSDPELMQEAITRLGGETSLSQVAVVSAPFPYGDRAGGRFVAPAKYLQVAMLNLMRARFLEQASGILSVDVDEFVRPMPFGSRHRTIFDVARAHPTGCVSFQGKWVFAEGTSGPQPQRAHSHTAPDQFCRNFKWCLIPGSLADRFALAVHRPAGPLFAFTHSSATLYWHFQATTTGWKVPRFKRSTFGSFDPDLAHALQDHLPPL